MQRDADDSEDSDDRQIMSMTNTGLIGPLGETFKDPATYIDADFVEANLDEKL